MRLALLLGYGLPQVHITRSRDTNEGSSTNDRMNRICTIRVKRQPIPPHLRVPFGMSSQGFSYLIRLRASAPMGNAQCSPRQITVLCWLRQGNLRRRWREHEHMDHGTRGSDCRRPGRDGQVIRMIVGW